MPDLHATPELRAPPIAPEPPATHASAMLAEIRMLLDFVGGNANLRLKDLDVPCSDAAGAPLPLGNGIAPQSPQAVLRRLDGIGHKIQSPSQCAPLSAADTAFLHLLRDALNGLVRPASGMTIAYTWMTSFKTRHHTGPRLDLAAKAYPGLVPLARRHHICSYAFLVLALLATSFAVWESTKVALGKSLLNSLQELRSQKAVIDTETMQRESAGANPANWSDPTFPDANLSLHFCDNARYRGYRLTHPGDTGGVLAWWTDHEKTEAAKSDPGKAEDQNLPELLVFKTPAERDLCDRDGILASRFGLLYAALQQYRVDWPSLVGSSFTAIGIPFRALFDLFQRAAPPGAAGGNDIEWVIAARLLVLGNYVLPVTFALLGAIAYVIVDYFRKVRASLLAPPDLALGWIRLVLGLVVGACIGLLYSSSSPTSAAAGAAPSVATLMNALTLSACGVAFLAGFGVEGVFSMLETVIRRVFPAEPRDQPPA